MLSMDNGGIDFIKSSMALGSRTPIKSAMTSGGMASSRDAILSGGSFSSTSASLSCGIALNILESVVVLTDLQYNHHNNKTYHDKQTTQCVLIVHKFDIGKRELLNIFLAYYKLVTACIINI